MLALCILQTYFKKIHGFWAEVTPILRQRATAIGCERSVQKLAMKKELKRHNEDFTAGTLTFAACE